MSNSIHPQEAFQSEESLILADVRKENARTISGETIAGSIYRHPFDAYNWHRQFAGRKTAVFCVHGHQVSQTVCGYLRDMNIDASYIAGGFEA